MCNIKTIIRIFRESADSNCFKGLGRDSDLFNQQPF